MHRLHNCMVISDNCIDAVITYDNVVCSIYPVKTIHAQLWHSQRKVGICLLHLNLVRQQLLPMPWIIDTNRDFLNSNCPASAMITIHAWYQASVPMHKQQALKWKSPSAFTLKKKPPASKHLVGSPQCCSFQQAGWCSTRRLLSFRALSLQPSWVLICPNHLWGSSELQPAGAEMGFITAAPVLAHSSLFCSISLPLCSAAPRRHASETGASSLVLHHHSTSTICPPPPNPLPHEMKPFMKRNEFA